MHPAIWIVGLIAAYFVVKNKGGLSKVLSTATGKDSGSFTIQDPRTSTVQAPLSNFQGAGAGVAGPGGSIGGGTSFAYDGEMHATLLPVNYPLSGGTIVGIAPAPPVAVPAGLGTGSSIVIGPTGPAVSVPPFLTVAMAPPRAGQSFNPLPLYQTNQAQA